MCLGGGRRLIRHVPPGPDLGPVLSISSSFFAATYGLGAGTLLGGRIQLRLWPGGCVGGGGGRRGPVWTQSSQGRRIPVSKFGVPEEDDVRKDNGDSNDGDCNGGADGDGKSRSIPTDDLSLGVNGVCDTRVGRV